MEHLKSFDYDKEVNNKREPRSSHSMNNRDLISSNKQTKTIFEDEYIVLDS
jgi:hypothetical protein